MMIEVLAYPIRMLRIKNNCRGWESREQWSAN